MDIIFTVVGLVILLLAGDALVRGAVNLGLRLGIPALIVSLTIVAFGTSAPEMLIAVKAALEGVPGIALGNVVGSNTANVLMVLGIPAIIAGINSSQCDTVKTYFYMLGSLVIFIVLAFLGPFHIWHGVILLGLLAAMLTETFLTARKIRNSESSDCAPDLEEIDEADPNMAGWRIVLYLVLGLIGLPLGADLMVDGSLGLARKFGVSEAVIGLTIVAIGTSLPELATTIVAALRKHGDVALGSVIGSNMFNVLAIMGVASMFGPLEVPAGILQVDVWVMLASALAMGPFILWRKNITRFWGVILTGLYLVYLGFLLT